MAHFMGVVKGNRGEGSRLGSKKSGMETWAASYSGAVRTYLWHENGVDMAVVELRPWQGAGTTRCLYRGPVDEGPQYHYNAVPVLLDALKDLTALYEVSPGRDPRFVAKAQAAIKNVQPENSASPSAE